MRAAVLSNWVRFNQPFEGVEPFLYTDGEGLVTTAMGNLVDASQSGSSTPWAPALAYPWKNPDGSLTDAATVQAAWQIVKDAYPGVTSVACASLTSIRLDAAGIQQAVSNELASDEAVLRRYFAAWDSFCSDAQMGICSMAWAMGPGFPPGFPQFTAAANAGEWAIAGSLSDFRDPGGGVAGRIAADKLCFTNAQAVADGGLDPETLYWPGVATASSLSRVARGAGAVILVAGVGAAGWYAAAPASAMRAARAGLAFAHHALAAGKALVQR
jgi:GH24 family phage-related lysozyme (muramidase)